MSACSHRFIGGIATPATSFALLVVEMWFISFGQLKYGVKFKFRPGGPRPSIRAGSRLGHVSSRRDSESGSRESGSGPRDSDCGSAGDCFISESGGQPAGLRAVRSWAECVRPSDRGSASALIDTFRTARAPGRMPRWRHWRRLSRLGSTPLGRSAGSGSGRQGRFTRVTSLLRSL